MNYFKRRDTEEMVWNVITSFGYDEEDDFCKRDRYFLLDKKEATIVSGATKMSQAEAAAVCIEAAFACNCDDFSVKISDKEIYDILILFGFENIISLKGDIKNSFVLTSQDTTFARGDFEESKTVARIDIEKLSMLCQNAEGASGLPSKTLVFAEKDAEGAAYDICYTLRVNGCIVEMYCGIGDIKSACAYADMEGHSTIIRCFADGAVEIKELSDNEVIKTTVAEFLGYYDDEDDDCGCGHSHEDGHCDCGHHH